MVFSNGRTNLMGATLAVGLTLFSGLVFAAEQRSANDIINALKSPRVTRGLTTSPADAARAADETQFIDALRNRPTRSLSTEERDKIASIASSKPKIDLEINFEYNSAVIGSNAMPQVTELGTALTSADLKGHTFILAGFTDAKGSESYNQGLSERRADAVRQLLSKNYGIEAGNLVTVGYGLSHLKDPANPFAAENRRVQVINARREVIALRCSAWNEIPQPPWRGVTIWRLHWKPIAASFAFRQCGSDR